MKKIILLISIAFQAICGPAANAQVLNVTNNEQEYNQWCWAACSKAILNYYGYNTPHQCDIAEWVRTTATFHDFGATNCCTNANQGCNYWNYNWGEAGSLHDILVHFGNIQNTGVSQALTLAEINTEIQNHRPFVIRWGWSTGGGHFLVGYGVNGSNIYFMNPWFGEGLHIAAYNSVVSGVDNTSSATHTWTHTNKMNSSATAVGTLPGKSGVTIAVSPNPFHSDATLTSDKSLSDATLIMYNSLGQQVKSLRNISGKTVLLQRNNIASGIYFYRLAEKNEIIATGRLVVSDN